MYIVDIKRTPIGKFLGSLSKLSAPELTLPLFAYFLKEYPFLRKQTNEVIIGNVLTAGIGMNPARIAAYKGGIGKSVPAYTVNHVCASGLNSVVQGYRSIASGNADLVLAGGMESMSQAPYLVRDIRRGIKFGDQVMIDSLRNDGLYCTMSDSLMGLTAENIAEKYMIERNVQDEYALGSHQRVVLSQESGILSEEIIPLPELNFDESVRSDTTLEKLLTLQPVFKANGTVTSGNASGVNDGAALCLLASKNAIKKYDLKPKAKILDALFIGLDPKFMGMGAQVAIAKILKKNGLSPKDIDLFEINEAFSVQVLAVIEKLKIKSDKVNIYGGAIALGHPIGMSGTRIIGSLINGLKRTGGRFGIASLCVGGGQGAAILIKNI